jgi:hypothetical protein
MAVYTDQFDIANVVNYLNKHFSDQVFKGNPLMALLQEKGMKKSVDGGYTLREPLMTGINSTAGWLPGSYDELDFTPQAGVAHADFPFKIYTVQVVMSELEQAQNRGGSKMIDLWEFKLEQAKKTAQAQFNADCYKDGTQDAAAVTGLEAIIATTGTYGGIARSGNTFWQAGYVDATAETISENRMLTAFNTASQNGMEFPDLIITTRAIWQTYHGLLTDNVRYEDKTMANLGFKSLTFMGIPIVWDNDCPSGTMYFVDTDAIRLRYMEGYDLQWTGKRQPTRQLLDAIICRWYGNLTAQSIRTNAKLTGKS